MVQPSNPNPGNAPEPFERDSNAPECHDDDEEHRLLESVLRETMAATSSTDALQLISEVARRSKYPDVSEMRAVEEVVRAIIAKRFGERRLGGQLIRRVAELLVEDPEATVRLHRVWNEARRHAR